MNLVKMLKTSPGGIKPRSPRLSASATSTSPPTSGSSSTPTPTRTGSRRCWPMTSQSMTRSTNRKKVKKHFHVTFPSYLLNSYHRTRLHTLGQSILLNTFFSLISVPVLFGYYRLVGDITVLGCNLIDWQDKFSHC